MKMGDLVRILLVDDDEDDYILTRDLLAEIPEANFVLEWVSDFDEAIEVICANQHDLILVDYRLGKKDGLELIRESFRRSCQSAMILLTGQGEREVDYAAMEAGAADYLEKSRLDAGILERSIRYTLQKKRYSDQLERKVEERTRELAESNRSLKAEIEERSRVEATLREADHRKDEFLATLAHELRSPLVPIRNSVEIVQLCDHEPEVVRKSLETIGRHVQTLVRLIDDLVDVSRISRGMIQLRPQTVNVESIVANAVECVRPLSDQRGHQLDVALPAEPIFLEADPTRLSQVVTNLLNNAARYTPHGGRITLLVDVRDHDLIIIVRDTGVGLPPEKLESIFDIFTRIDRGDDESMRGMGIGLWLVANLVNLHGGRVEAASDGLGCGSEFRVTLPLERRLRDGPA